MADQSVKPHNELTPKHAITDRDVPNQTVLINNVSKTYVATKGTAVNALKDVSLTIQHGEVVTLVGPSGCGKSTLLRILAGLSSPTNGGITIGGKEHTGPSPAIGVVYQQPQLLPWKNVLENILLPVRVRRLKVDKYRSRAMDLIEMTGLKGFENSYPHQLSGGMQQRVGIARAMIQDPKILLMDEPFGALDAMTRDQMTMELLRVQAEFNQTIVFVTHSITESVLLADKVAVMSARPGRISGMVPVPLPRPRQLHDVNTPEFGECADTVRDILESAEAA